MSKRITIDPIISRTGLEARLATLISTRIQHTAAVAEMEQEVSQVQARHQARINKLAAEIDQLEAPIVMFCQAQRSELFTEKKSLETPLATVGFRLHPYSVEKIRKKDTEKEIALRLACTPWGSAYSVPQDPKIDKQAIILDRDSLTTEQLASVGLRLEQEESFYIEPRLESASTTTQPA